MKLALTAAWLAATSRALLAPPRQILALRPAVPVQPRATVRLGAADAAAESKPSLVARFNNFGLSLKDRSRRQREALKGANLLLKLPRGAYVAALSLAFVAYRAYRGFFVVLPAVYGEVYAQALAQATEEHVSIRGVEVADDIDPKTGKLRMRSRVVMNVGALAFMGALMVGGAVRAPIRIAAACLRKVGLLPRESTEATPADRLAAKEKELDLPPLPDIPDDVPPDTDDV
jgi:hypothetical protein